GGAQWGRGDLFLRIPPSVGLHAGDCRRGAGGGACGGGVPGAHQDLRGGQGGHARGARRVGGGWDQGGDHRRDRGDRGRGGGGARRRRGRGRGICVTGAEIGRAHV